MPSAPGRFLAEPRPASRAQYQRALLLLPLAWPRFCRQHDLTSDAFVVLSVLLSMQPGRWIHQANRVSDPRKSPGLAEVLGWDRQRVLRALSKLRAAGLVLARLYTQADALPSGRHPRTNILRYFVHVALIESTAKNEPPDGSPDEPSPGSASTRDSPPPTPSRAAHHRRRSPSASPAATHIASETSTSALESPSPSAAPATPTPEDESERHLRGKEENEGHAVDALCAQWNALGLPDAGGTVSSCRSSERAAVRNRLRELGYELVHRAVVGAGDSDWLRRGRARSALAFVFASATSIQRFALDGEAVLRQRAAAATAAGLRAAQHRDAASVADLWQRAPWPPRNAPPEFLRAIGRRDFDAAEACLLAMQPEPTAERMTASASVCPVPEFNNTLLNHGAAQSAARLQPATPEGCEKRDRRMAQTSNSSTSCFAKPPSRTERQGETDPETAYRLQADFDRRAQEARLALARWIAQQPPVAPSRRDSG